MFFGGRKWLCVSTHIVAQLATGELKKHYTGNLTEISADNMEDIVGAANGDPTTVLGEAHSIAKDLGGEVRLLAQPSLPIGSEGCAHVWAAAHVIVEGRVVAEVLAEANFPCPFTN